MEKSTVGMVNRKSDVRRTSNEEQEDSETSNEYQADLTPPVETVFLSGATGSLGSEVLRILLARGFNVKILVRDINRVSPIFLKQWDELPGSIEEIVEGDLSLSDGATKGRIFSGMRDCSIVYHCAGIPEGWQVHEEIWDAVNRNGTQVMLAAADAAKVRVFVHISSFETILFNRQNCNSEISSKQTPYQRSKLNAEAAVELARSKSKGMRYVIINSASFYGPTSRTCWVNHFILSMLSGKDTKVTPALV